MGAAMSRCVVCTQTAKTWMCGECQASFDRLRDLDDGTMLSVIKWAAERARLMGEARLRHAEADAEQAIHYVEGERDQMKAAIQMLWDEANDHSRIMSSGLVLSGVVRDRVEAAIGKAKP